MAIYTGGGDRGKTSLLSGERVFKDNDRIDALGDLDELNSSLGFLAAGLPETLSAAAAEIERIQSVLLQVGAWVSVSPDSDIQTHLSRLQPEASAQLETAIDRMEAQLPPLQGFLLPGGTLAAARAHMARAVCRRTERRIVRLLSQNPQYRQADSLSEEIVFINRLSDYLFVLARHINREMGVSETLWSK